MSNDFYRSDEWRRLRYRVLRKFGFKCMACGRDANDGVKIHVDHIKPRSVKPWLELEESNLQVLCEDCNLGKSSTFQDKFRLLPNEFGEEFTRSGGMSSKLKRFLKIELEASTGVDLCAELDRIMAIHRSNFKKLKGVEQ